jgi:transcriptional regulator of arginine metabolism
MMNKSYRQGQIVKLIRAKEISTQEELAHELRKLGIEATQVTLSRDIRELGLVKTADGYTQIVPQAKGPDLPTILAEFLQDVRVAQNLLVLKTLPAHASSLAVALDNEEWPEVVGTIAGDDTVLVIAPDSRIAHALQGKLLGYISGE